MQLKNFVLILLTLIIAPALAQVEPDELKRNFLEQSGLREGGIELIEGSEDCIATNLRVLEIDEGRTFTLTVSLGAQPLIVGIGVPQTKYTDRGCETVEAATTSARSIRFTRAQECSNGLGKLNYEVNVRVNDTGFEFTRINKNNDKVTLRMTCKYRFN